MFSIQALDRLRDVRIGEDCSFTSFCEIRDRCELGDKVLMGSRGTLSAGTVVEDEVVMKYLLAKHQPELLCQLGVRFAAPTGKFDGAPPKRWT